MADLYSRSNSYLRRLKLAHLLGPLRIICAGRCMHSCHYDIDCPALLHAGKVVETSSAASSIRAEGHASLVKHLIPGSMLSCCL